MFCSITSHGSRGYFTNIMFHSKSLSNHRKFSVRFLAKWQPRPANSSSSLKWKPFFAMVSGSSVVPGSKEENGTFREGPFWSALKHWWKVIGKLTTILLALGCEIPWSLTLTPTYFGWSLHVSFGNMSIDCIPAALLLGSIKSSSRYPQPDRETGA